MGFGLPICKIESLQFSYLCRPFQLTLHCVCHCTVEAGPALSTPSSKQQLLPELWPSQHQLLWTLQGQGCPPAQCTASLQLSAGAASCYLPPSVSRAKVSWKEGTGPSFPPDLALGQVGAQGASGNSGDVCSRHGVALFLIINSSKY